MQISRIASIMRKEPYLVNAVLISTVLPIACASYASWHALHGPNISLRWGSEEPYQKFANKKYNYYSPIDIEKYEHPRPHFDWR